MAGEEDHDSTEERSEARREAPSVVSCFWCGRLHHGAHALSVCAACTARLATMQSLEMSGAYPLSNDRIDETLGRTSPGNYALGYMDGDTFVVFYVGRSDCDLRQRLHDWVDVPSRDERYASAARAPWGVRHRGLLPFGAPTFARVESAGSGYTHFAYSYARSADEAYAKEWRNYDAFGGSHGLDNESEPRSSGADETRGTPTSAARSAIA